MRGRSILAALSVLPLAPLALAAPSAGAAAATPGPSGSAPATLPGAAQPPGAPGGSTVAPAAAAQPLGSPPRKPSTRRRADEILSNERTFTRWAYVARMGAIYRYPSASSRPVTKLRWYTPDGFREIYLLLRAHWDAQGQEWVELRIPMRPNGKTGWVRLSDLGSFHMDHQMVVINRERLRMYFFSHGRLLWSAPVGVGKPSTPTPAGNFWITERYKIAESSSGYWPYAFGTSDYSTLSNWPGEGVVGIHGPYYAPEQIPGYISHGCVRLHVPDDFWFAAHVTLGTPLHVV